MSCRHQQYDVAVKGSFCDCAKNCNALAEELILICAIDVVKCRLIKLRLQPLSNDPTEELKIRRNFCYHRSLIKSTFFFNYCLDHATCWINRCYKFGSPRSRRYESSNSTETWKFLFWKYLKITGTKELFFKRWQRRFGIEWKRERKRRLVVVTDGVPYILGRRSRLQVFDKNCRMRISARPVWYIGRCWLREAYPQVWNK
jgi:hypothetical protein